LLHKSKIRCGVTPGWASSLLTSSTTAVYIVVTRRERVWRPGSLTGRLSGRATASTLRNSDQARRHVRRVASADAQVDGHEQEGGVWWIGTDLGSRDRRSKKKQKERKKYLSRRYAQDTQKIRKTAYLCVSCAYLCVCVRICAYLVRICAYLSVNLVLNQRSLPFSDLRLCGRIHANNTPHDL
jgi:hypothetical protein